MHKKTTAVKLWLLYRNVLNHLSVYEKKMSLSLFKNIINKMCLQIMYSINMHTQDLALNNLQWLICHKTKRNLHLSHNKGFWLLSSCYGLVWTCKVFVPKLDNIACLSVWFLNHTRSVSAHQQPRYYQPQQIPLPRLELLRSCDIGEAHQLLPKYCEVVVEKLPWRSG